jgi:hypothetical protein
MGPKRHATSSRDVTTPSRCDGTERCGRGRQQPRGVGDGTTTNRLRPVRVEGLIHVIQIGAGAYHSSPLDRTQRCGRGAGTDGASSGSGRSRLFESGPSERSREPRIDRRRTPAQHRRRPQRRGVQLGIERVRSARQWDDERHGADAPCPGVRGGRRERGRGRPLVQRRRYLIPAPIGPARAPVIPVDILGTHAPVTALRPDAPRGSL